MNLTTWITKNLNEMKFEGYDNWYFVPASSGDRFMFACLNSQGCNPAIREPGYNLTPIQALAAIGGCTPTTVNPDINSFVRRAIEKMYDYIEEQEAVQ